MSVIVKRFMGIFLPVAVFLGAVFVGFYENKKNRHRFPEVWKQISKQGFIGDVQQEANRLKQIDSQYIPFADKLLQLSQDLDEPAILDLVKPLV